MIGWRNRGGSARMQELGLDQRVDRVGRRVAVDARDLRGVRQRGIVAEDRERSRDGRRPPAGGACSRAATKRATDGGPMAAIVPASEARARRRAPRAP